MNPRILVMDGRGMIARPFQRHLSTLTTLPVRGDLTITEGRERLPSPDLKAFWLSAFNRTLRDEPIVSGGLPTRYLLDEMRGIEND